MSDTKSKGSPPVAILKILAAEFEHLAAMMRVVDYEFGKRVSIRVVLSLLEAYSFHLKRLALEANRRTKKLTHEVLVELHKRKGPKRQKLETALAAFAVAFSVESLEGGAVPESYAVAKAARDRITHPGSPADFLVKPAEAEALVDLMRWLHRLAAWANDAYQGELRRIMAGMNEDPYP